MCAVCAWRVVWVFCVGSGEKETHRERASKQASEQEKWEVCCGGLVGIREGVLGTRGIVCCVELEMDTKEQKTQQTGHERTEDAPRGESAAFQWEGREVDPATPRPVRGEKM
jgi:hypothetical protein